MCASFFLRLNNRNASLPTKALTATSRSNKFAHQKAAWSFQQHVIVSHPLSSVVHHEQQKGAVQLAMCTYCEQDMSLRISCSLPVYDDFVDGVTRERIAFTDGYRNSNCGDCGTPRGGFHHPGCYFERCPRCYGLASKCFCAVDFTQKHNTDTG